MVSVIKRSSVRPSVPLINSSSGDRRVCCWVGRGQQMSITMQRADRVYYFVSDCQEVQPTGWFDCVTLHTPACAAFDASVDTKFTWFHSVKSSSSVIACFYIAYWTQLLVYQALWLVYLRMSAFGKLFFVIPLPLAFSMHILCFHKIHAQNWFLYRSKSFRISFQDGKTVSVVKFVLITKLMQICRVFHKRENCFCCTCGTAIHS